MSQNLLEVNHLKKYFKTGAGMLHAVDDVSFAIPKGKTMGVVGESGCGKSTLGRTLLQLYVPTAGEIIFQGKNVANLSKKEFNRIRPKMQMIFQDPYSSLNGRMNVFQLIAEPLIVNKICKDKKEIEARVAKMMDTVGLASRLVMAYPHDLDGGRRQRIGVARALILEPEFVVCDEPVSALDVSIQAQILNLLMDLGDELNLTYLFITHDLSVVKHISDRIMVMYLGQAVEIAPSEELFNNPLHPYTQALLAAIPEPDLSKRDIPFKTIKGEVSSPINVKPGCRFCKRCEFATAACEGADKPLVEVSPGHFVACELHK